jgi:hypothetical protein
MRLDAVGFSSVPPLYREGNGLNSGRVVFISEHSFYRNLISGLPQDSDDNAADFLGVDTRGLVTAAGQRLGAPGPENLSSQIQNNVGIKASLLDPLACSACPPNRVREGSPIPNGAFGTLIIRRKFTNHTGRFVNRLRFRVVDITTFPAPDATTADLRVVSSFPSSVTLTDGTTVKVQGTFLEEPPVQGELLGGGWNSSLMMGVSGLAPGASVNVQFVLGVEQSGSFRFLINVETDGGAADTPVLLPVTTHEDSDP